MYGAVQNQLTETLDTLRNDGLFKTERVIETPQRVEIRANGREVLNFCANNYLGLADHPRLIAAAIKAIETHGLGMASVRFICGTQDIHKELEAAVAQFLSTEDTILYSSCFDANGGLFETLLPDEDHAVISDQLNHASIIDGIRLCKAERHRYSHGDLSQLEGALKATQTKKSRLITTDGVFSMDGAYAKLNDICDLAEKYGALVHIDECHSTGFVGATGRGTPEMFDVTGRVDIITGTFGKALGGSAGGFTSARKEIVELLRQRSRPYLFSNTLAPAIVGASIECLTMLGESTALRDRVNANALWFRAAMADAGFTLKPGTHPIVPVMLGDAKLAQAMAKDLLDEGIYVIGFFFPVVPKGQARIRVQLSAAHTQAHLEKAVEAFTKVGRKHGVV
jgi:glycine C-acetyltransferase